jgi:hypothetical protein
LAKEKNPGIVFTQCFLHRVALISKSVVAEDWMRRSKWLTTWRVGHHSRGCFQHCVLPWKLLTHTAPVAHGSEGAFKVLWTEGRGYNFSRLKSLSWLTCLVMRPGAIKLLS